MKRDNMKTKSGLPIENVTDGWQRVRYERYRTKKWFSLFGITICDGYDSGFHRTGKFFGFVEIEQQFTMERFSDFDDGWTYQHYWKGWEPKWMLIKII